MGAAIIKNKRIWIIISVLMVIILYFGLENSPSNRIIKQIRNDYTKKEKISDKDIKEFNESIRCEYLDLYEEYFIKAHISLQENETKYISKKFFRLAEENFNERTDEFIKIDTYLNMIEILLDLNNAEEAVFYFDKLFSSIKCANEYSKYFYQVDKLLSRLSNIDGQRGQALNFYREFSKNNKQCNKYQKITIYRRIAILSAATSNYIESIENNMYIICQTEGANNDQDRYYLVKSIIDLASITRKVGGGYISESIMSYADNFPLEDKQLNAEVNTYRLINLAEIKILNKEYDSAEEYLNKIDKYIPMLNPEIKDDIEAMKNIFYTDIYLDRGEISEAKRCINKAKEMMNDNQNISYIDKEIYYYIAYGNILFGSKKYDEALEYYNTAINKSNSTGNIEMLNVSYLKVAKVFNALGEYQKEKENYKELVDVEKNKSKLMLEDYYNYIIYKDKNMKALEHKIKDRVLTIGLIATILIAIIVLIKLFLWPIVCKFLKKRRIKKDIKDNKYSLYYQPIINPRTMLISSAEGLLRLKDNDNIVMPNNTITEIKKYDMMGYVTLFILQKAIEGYRVISKFEKLEKDFYVSINISFSDIQNDIVFQKMIDILGDSKLESNSICLEIARDDKTTNIDKIKANIGKLREVGFKIAVDNFCIDYVNLNLLKNVNYDIAKVDVNIIDLLLNSNGDKEIIELLQMIIKKRNIKLIIEGVETKEENEFICNLNLDELYIQGYYYSQPVDVDNVIKFEFANDNKR